MTLSVEKKRLMLGGALLLTLGASAWLSMDHVEEGAEVVASAKPVSAKRNDTPELSLPVLANAHAVNKSEQQATDVFKSHRWFVPPPPLSPSSPPSPPPRPVEVVVAPPAPVAPPLPFTYLGTVQDGANKVVFLAKGQHLYTVRKGEVFDGQYRLEDEGNGRIELVYLPLNIKQIIVTTKGAS
ncbi:MAG: hypothetical protein ABL865_04070 [Candidatus Nitrotoga sp.]